jgi:hypothetical protein
MLAVLDSGLSGFGGLAAKAILRPRPKTMGAHVRCGRRDGLPLAPHGPLRYRRVAVVRSWTLIGVVVALVLAGSAVAAGPQFVVVTKSGDSESLSYFSYTFGVATPPLGKPGSIQVDCEAPNEAMLKKALPVGAQLSSAKLEISAELPTPQHFSYVLADARIKAILFVTGHFGPSAAITLSFTKLSK